MQLLNPKKKINLYFEIATINAFKKEFSGIKIGGCRFDMRILFGGTSKSVKRTS